MIKILYIWKGPFPFEIRIEKICRSLIKFGYDVSVLCLNPHGMKPRKENFAGIKIFRTESDGAKYKPIPYNPNWKHLIYRVVQEIHPDLIINREFYLLTETLAAAGKIGIPVIVDMAENYPAALREFQNSQTLLKQFLFRTLQLPDHYEKFCIPKAQGVIVVCEEQIERLEKIGVPAENIAVVQNTPSLVSSDAAIPDFKQNDEFTFVHHGYLSRDKSIAEFLKGFLLFSERRGGVRLILAGDGEYAGEYKKIVSASPNKDKVVFTGSYKIEDLNSIIRQADCGVLPFLPTDFNNYTIQNKLFDYFSNARPVLVSNCKPLERIINETEAGISADCSTPENSVLAIEKMLNTCSSEMSRNAQEAFRKKYNWENDENVLAEFIKKFI